MLINILRKEDGVAAIEFAVLLPLLTVMLLGLWDISIFAREKMRLEQAVRSVGSIATATNADNNSLLRANFLLTELYKTPNGNKPSIDFVDVCVCQSVTSSCYQLCANSRMPDRIITISAEVLVAGVIIPNRLVRSTLDVKVR